MNRDTILNKAIQATKDRGQDYGKPSENFERIASLWAAYKSEPFSAQDVGMMMMLVKVSRLMESPLHEDSWVDIAGYSAITAEAIACTEDSQHPLEDQQSTEPKTQGNHYSDQSPEELLDQTSVAQSPW